MSFRLLWPVAMLVLFFVTLGLVGTVLPRGLSPWAGLFLFVGIGAGFAAFANWWGPLLFYRLRARGRDSWCERNGFVRLRSAQWPSWLPELRKLFRRPEKGIVLGVCRGGRFTMIDYTYLRRYGSTNPHGRGVEAREGVTVVVGELGRSFPSIDVTPLSFGARAARALMARQLASMNLDAVLSPGVETGDAAFDEAYVTTGPGEAGSILTGDVRRWLLQRPGTSLHLRQHRFLVHRGALISNRRLHELVVLAGELGDGLERVP